MNKLVSLLKIEHLEGGGYNVDSIGIVGIILAISIVNLIIDLF